jgi:hypothetical protein
VKRLTDAQVASGYERRPGAPSVGSLRKDHLQAREYVKRLVQFLEAAEEDGAVDWEQWETLRHEVSP